jgi:hypothetical protein
VPCNEPACVGGLAWTAAPADGATIRPGEYRLDILLEGTPHAIVCTIAASLRDSECSAAVTPDGMSDFDLSVDLAPRQVGDTWDPDAPVEAMRITMADHSDFDDDDRSQSVRGPEEVDVTLTLEGRVLLQESFAPEYERDENFYGDERCGYCDEQVEEASSWVP